jgi:hypothetical protein
MCQPSEGSFYEWFRLFVDTVTMSDDQLVEIPGKQRFKRLPREISIGEGQPDIETNAAIRSCATRQS